MSTYSIYVKTIEHASYVINEYKLEDAILWPPTHGSYGRWVLTWISQGSIGRVAITMILFPTVITLLFKKYGITVEELLLPIVRKTKEKGLVRAVWKHLSDEKRKTLTAEFLGGNEIQYNQS